MPLIPGMGLNDGPTRARPRTQGLDVRQIPGPFDNFTYRPPPVSARAPVMNRACRRTRMRPPLPGRSTTRPGARSGARAPRIGRRTRAATRASPVARLRRSHADLLRILRGSGDPCAWAGCGVRKCVITYHLEDGTLDVREPRGVNSGILRSWTSRTSGACAWTSPRLALRALDFNVGVDRHLCSRTYSILPATPSRATFSRARARRSPRTSHFPSSATPRRRRERFRRLRPSSAPPARPHAVLSIDLDLPLDLSLDSSGS